MLQSINQAHELFLGLITEVNREVLANQHTVSTQMVNNRLCLAGVAVI